jgi:hypothetical protein
VTKLLTKTIDTLVKDIQGLFGEEPHECDPERVKELGLALGEKISARLAEDRRSQPGTLRMSNLGKPDRQLWYEVHRRDIGEKLTPSTKIKFLFGDILELLLLFLAKEAGHEVTHEQEKVEVDGIYGSCDAVIDGVLVDTKSASKFSFEKFRKGELKYDDPFGYYEQLAGYSEGLGGLPGAWLVIGKELGHLTLLEAPKEDLSAIDIRTRIGHLKQVVSSEDMPERCYEPQEMGVSGNLKLGKNCSYCPFKQDCWKDANGGLGLRTFSYSGGPVHLVHVEKEPNVPEITF